MENLNNPLDSWDRFASGDAAIIGEKLAELGYEYYTDGGSEDDGSEDGGSEDDVYTTYVKEYPEGKNFITLYDRYNEETEETDFVFWEIANESGEMNEPDEDSVLVSGSTEESLLEALAKDRFWVSDFGE